jgi:molecular chaperone DnaK (HSP70)
MIWDGGTFDVSLLTIDNGTFQTRATNGDMHLVGEDFDGKVIDYFSKKIAKKYKVDLRKHKRGFQKLKQAVEKEKIILSTDLENIIDIDPLFNNVHFKEKLTRARFEDLNKDLFKRTLKPASIS